LPQPQWNSADVTGPDPDLDVARAWFAQRGLPWGVRVPDGLPVPATPHVVTLRMMATAQRRPGPEVPGLELRVAGPEDEDVVVATDAEAFGHEAREWMAPMLAAPGIEVGLALLDGAPVATAYTTRSDGRGGPAVMLNGVGVVPAARRRGVAGALSAWLLARAPGRVAHLWAEDEEAARVYQRLGFADAGTLRIHEGVR
ncbi:MAG: GNAT family N-acetyltransferase, partial [Solirubrobacterales bacterium]|nr:GNAT family N-acetyltransferase [Solirubrobacterales bacterium]